MSLGVDQENDGEFMSFGVQEMGSSGVCLITSTVALSGQSVYTVTLVIIINELFNHTF